MVRRYTSTKELFRDLKDAIGAGLTLTAIEAQQDIKDFTPVYTGRLRASLNVAQGIPDLSVAPDGNDVPNSIPDPGLWGGVVRLDAGPIFITSNLHYSIEIYLKGGSRKLDIETFPDYVEFEIPKLLEANLSEALLGIEG